MVVSLAACGSFNKSGGNDEKDSAVYSEDAENALSEKEEGSPSDSGNSSAPADTEPVESVITVGETNTVENFAEFSMFRIMTTDKVTASCMGTSMRTYSLTDDSERIIVDTTFDWTNTSSDYIDIRELMTVTATAADGTVYDECTFSTEAEGMDGVARRDLYLYSEIEPGASARIHCSVPVPQDTENLTIKYTVRNHTFDYDYRLGDIDTSAKELKLGDKLEAECGSLTISDIIYQSTFMPDAIPSMGVTVMGHDPELNTFLAPVMTLTSKADKMLPPDNFVNITAQYTGEYHLYYDSMYPEVAFYEVESLPEVDIPGYTSEIYPGQTYSPIYYLITIQKTSMGQPLTLLISFGGEDYIYRGE